MLLPKPGSSLRFLQLPGLPSRSLPQAHNHLRNRHTGFHKALCSSQIRGCKYPYRSPTALRTLGNSFIDPKTWYYQTEPIRHASTMPAFVPNPAFLVDDSPINWVGLTAVISIPLLFGLLVIAYAYRSTIIEQMRQLEEDSLLFGLNLQMDRSADQKNGVFRNLEILELDKSNKQALEDESNLQLISLGAYMRQLKPAVLPRSVHMKDIPELFQGELEAALSAALLKALGPTLGRAFLPLTKTIQGPTRALATRLAAKALASSQTAHQGDRAGIPINLMSVLSFSDLNARVQGMNPSEQSLDVEQNTKESDTPIYKMKAGETGHSTSFVDFVSSPFNMETDFDIAIQKMEDAMKKESAQASKDNGAMMDEIGGVAPSINLSSGYHPEGRAMSPPVPINPKLLPDLHLGWGDAQCTHTNREVFQNRLLSVLLNKLASNYYTRLTEDGTSECFVVSYLDRNITTPGELIEALIASGHKVEATITTHITTFGIALCVEEKDGGFSNIPLACFVDSGYEDKEGNTAAVAMPHSGMDLFVSGPLFPDRGDGEPSNLNIQHFIAIDGFCGWYTNHNANVPWLKSVECGPRLSETEATRAVRLAGLYATALNGLATERNLPFGGYGLTAVCNDSAAVMEECLYGTCSIYPMTSIGSYLMQTVRYIGDLQSKCHELGLDIEADSLGTLLVAMSKIPSDLNASPGGALDSSHRVLQSMPEKPTFALMSDCQKVMHSLRDEKVLSEMSKVS